MSKTHMPMWKSVISFYASFTCRFISYNKSELCYTGMWGERPHGSERLSTGNCQQCVGGRDQQASARKTLVSHTKRFITIHYIQNGMTHRLNSTWSTHWFLVNSTKSVYILCEQHINHMAYPYLGSNDTKDNVNENQILIEISNC